MKIWKPIPGYDLTYEASACGSVRSISTSNERKPQVTYKGYATLKMPNLDGKGQRTRTIHSMVAEAFLGRKPAINSQVNHKDGNKLNNAAGNLEWVTPRENIKHAISTGLSVPFGGSPGVTGLKQKGSLNYNSKITENDVLEIKRRLREGAISLALAKEYGVSSSLIYAIKNGRRWGHLDG